MFSSKELLNNVKNKYKNNVNNDNKINNNVNNVKHKQVSDIANTLVTKLNSPNSYKLFCKIAYMNSQATIDRCVGLTLESPTVRNKGGYFVSLIKAYGNF